MNNALTTLYIVFDISKEDESFFAGALTSSSYIGALFGGIITTFIKKYHTGIIIADICLFLGSSLLIMDNIYIFFLGRIIAGIGCGMCAVCQPVFIREFSPTLMYSTMGGLLSAVFSFGYFLTMLFGVWFPTPKDD
jgi:SP family sugar:H+ symporter-like MFS transporter